MKLTFKNRSDADSVLRVLFSSAYIYKSLPFGMNWVEKNNSVLGLPG